MNEMVVMGPMKRRAMLADEIEQTHKKLRKAAVDFESLDASLHKFDPTQELERIRPLAFRPPPPTTGRGAAG